MEVYVLDSLLRRERVVDRFESLIWTERFSEIGDFELILRSTRESRSQFITGTRLAVNTSYRVMIVETVEDETDSDGKKLLTVKGRSLEALLEDRVARPSHDNLAVAPTWRLGGRPGDIARQVFKEICVDGKLSLDDIIPFITAGSIMPNDTISEPDTPIVVEFPPQTVFEAIKELCDIYDLGFRLLRNFDMSQLYFDIYTGSDRTTRQRDLPPIIFSVENDNLQNTKELDTIVGAKNVAYVYSEVGSAIVFAENVPVDVEGFDRRVLLVEASEVTADTVDIPAALRQKGWEELSKARSFSAFDGELNQRGSYRYGVDYNLGDIVEMRNEDGVITYKRVTEQIFVHDVEGERSYPTVSMDMFVAANTWRSQISTRVWEDFGLEEYWADQ